MAAAPSASPVVWWVRNDLRLTDNPVARGACGEAFTDGRPCLPIFILDPRFFDRSPYGRVTDPNFEKSIPTRRPIGFASRKCSALRARFILRCVRALAADLAACGSELRVHKGVPEAILGALPGGSLVVCQQEPVSVECSDIEDAVEAALQPGGGSLRREWGAMSLYHREDLPFRLVDGDIPTSFTELAVALGWDDVWTVATRWEGFTPVRPPVPAPAAFPAVPAIELPGRIASDVLMDDSAALKLLGYSEEEVAEALGQELPAGGEAEARSLLEAWITQQTEDKQEASEGDDAKKGAVFWDLPVGHGPGEGHDALQWANLAKPDGWMRMSHLLAIGCVSVREIFARAMDCVNFNGVAHRLLWREFHRLSAIRWGRRMFWLQGPGWVERPWTSDTALVDAWKAGRTGVPYIDACMRELRQTGWLAYKGRKTTGFFLVFGLGVDWRIGAYHFEDVLLDYDCAMNYGNWVTVAGVEKPRRAGRFDPDGKVSDLLEACRQDIELKLSAEMANDPSGEYIRRWVPELRGVPDAVVHRPWALSAEEMEKCGCVLGQHYPASLVGPLSLRATEEDFEEHPERRVHPHDQQGLSYTHAEFREFAQSRGKDESEGEKLWSEAISVTGFQEALQALEATLLAKDRELETLRSAAATSAVAAA